jgi:hypothetical protein
MEKNMHDHAQNYVTYKCKCVKKSKTNIIEKGGDPICVVGIMCTCKSPIIGTKQLTDITNSDVHPFQLEGL